MKGQRTLISVAVVDVHTLARNWWAVLLGGVSAVLFGLVTFIAPGISLTALVLLFGAYALADGSASPSSAVCGDAARATAGGHSSSRDWRAWW